MFAQMLEGIKEEAVGFFFNGEIQVAEPQEQVTLDPSAARLLPSSKPLLGRVVPAEQPAVFVARDRRRGRLRPTGPRAGARAGHRPGPGAQRRGVQRRSADRQWPGGRSSGRAAVSVNGGRTHAGTGPGGRDGGTVSQRTVLLRVGQEVQAVPRSTGRPLGDPSRGHETREPPVGATGNGPLRPPLYRPSTNVATVDAPGPLTASHRRRTVTPPGQSRRSRRPRCVRDAVPARATSRPATARRPPPRCCRAAR